MPDTLQGIKQLDGAGFPKRDGSAHLEAHRVAGFASAPVISGILNKAKFLNRHPGMTATALALKRTGRA